ncbi:MAG: D-sedoheptulose 7-phosphate isomerase [Armatimonadota bacterium]|jgi:D-sedoheptulose 7-phosphate isomerase
MGMAEIVRDRFADSIAVKQKAAQTLSVEIAQAVAEIVCSLRDGNKLLLCGNGGSAADAQHIAAEFVGRFILERAPVPAIALNTNSSTITAIGNDYSYDEVFSRQVKAFAKDGDVFIGISTSGNSECVIQAAQVAREYGAFTISLTGEHGGRLSECVDLALRVPSSVTARIQETHITIGHIICELVESELFAHAVV